MVKTILHYFLTAVKDLLPDATHQAGPGNWLSVSLHISVHMHTCPTDTSGYSGVGLLRALLVKWQSENYLVRGQ